jgi:acetyl/propionyl-CoA carboxylase alpha subunit
MKDIFIALVLLFPAVGFSSVSAQMTIKVVAPIDGFVIQVTEVNTRHKRTSSAAQVEYDLIRCKYNEEVRKDPDSRKKRRIEAEIAYISGCRENVGLKRPVFLVEVKSDVLELQVLQEQEKLVLAEMRLAAFMEAYNFDRTKRLPLENENREARANAAIAQLKIAGQFNVSKHAGLAKEAQDFGAQAVIKQSQLELDRHYFAVSDIERRREIAEKELALAQVSKAVLEATAKLGKMTCPSDCLVTKVLVAKGQYVTKGDVLLEIALQN